LIFVNRDGSYLWGAVGPNSAASTQSQGLLCGSQLHDAKGS
jgi:hypothetical protein